VSCVDVSFYFLVHCTFLDYQNGGRPPSWIWYDDIVDKLRFVFDGPNILLKLHVDRIYTLPDIMIFIFGPFGLKLPIHAPLGSFFKRILPQMHFDIVATPKGPPLGKNTSYDP